MSGDTASTGVNSSNIGVQAQFIQKLQPFLCGDSVIIRTTGFCSENPASINLDRYFTTGQAGDFVPRETPEAVQFCEDYRELYKKTNKLCLFVAPAVQEQLKGIAEGDSDLAKPLQIPPRRKIIEMLQTPDQDLTAEQRVALAEQQDRFYDYIQTKAQKIKSQLEVIALLRGKVSRKEIAQDELDAALSGFMRSIVFVCVEDKRDELERLDRECGKVIEIHGENKKILAKWIAGIAAAIAAAGGLAWRVLKSGKSKETVKAPKENWKEAKKRGEGFFGKLGSAWDALWRRINNESESSPPADADKAADGSPAVDPGPAGPDGKPAAANPNPEATPPPDVESEPEVELRDEFKPEIMVPKLSEAVDLLTSLAGEKLQGRGAQSKRIADTRTRILTMTDPQRRMLKLEGLLSSQEVIELVHQLVSRFEHEINDYLPSAAAKMTAAAASLERGDTDFGKGILKGLFSETNKIVEFAKRVSDLNAKMRLIYKAILGLKKIPEHEKFRARVEELHRYITTVFGGKDEILSSIGGALRIAISSPEDFVQTFRTLQRFDLSNTESISRAAIWLNAFRADKNKVAIRTEIGERIAIPLEAEEPLFTALYIAVRNGVKHFNDKLARGKKRFVKITFSRSPVDSKFLLVSVDDNGKGMSRENAASMFSKPDEGMGISRVIEMASKLGWSPEFIARGEGRGVLVKFRIDMSGWTREPSPPKGGSGTPPPASSSGGGSIVVADTPVPEIGLQGVLQDSVRVITARTMQSGITIVPAGLSGGRVIGRQPAAVNPVPPAFMAAPKAPPPKMFR